MKEETVDIDGVNVEVAIHDEPLETIKEAINANLSDQSVINEIKDILIKSYSSPAERVEIVEGLLTLLKYEAELSAKFGDLDIEGIKEVRKIDRSKWDKDLTEEDIKRIYGNVPDINECSASDRAKNDSKSLLTRMRGVGIL